MFQGGNYPRHEDFRSLPWRFLTEVGSLQIREIDRFFLAKRNKVDKNEQAREQYSIIISSVLIILSPWVSGF